jgi:hypothetical protein
MIREPTAELGAIAEELATSIHPRAIATRPLGLVRLPCRLGACGREPAVVVNGVQLCVDHASARLARLLWDAKIAALIDLIRSGGFELLHEDAIQERAS